MNHLRLGGAEETAQWSSTPAALQKKLSSIPSSHMVVHNHPYLQFQELQCPLLILIGTRHTSGAHTYMQQHTHIQTMNNSNINILKSNDKILVLRDNVLPTSFNEINFLGFAPKNLNPTPQFFFKGFSLFILL